MRTVEEFMAAFRGVPRHQLSRAMTNLHIGVNWNGCAKRHIANQWCAATRDRLTFAYLAKIEIADIQAELTRLYGEKV